MNSFSIMPYEHQSILDSYKQWLVSDLYQHYYFDNINDPNFLQKLSILQAEGIRHDIGVHAAVTHGSIQEASSQVGRKIQSAASLITSSLDDGFTMMNTRILGVNSNLRSIDKGIGTVNQTLQQGNQILSNIDGGIAQMNRGVNAVASGVAQMNRGVNAVASGVNRLDSHVVAGFNRLDSHVVAGFNQLDSHVLAGFAALDSNISQVASVIQYQLQQSEKVLRQILDELRIPESQRERRYHIEEGMKYFNKGMQSGDCLYFEDSLDEFSTAISIERKDFFSWYYTGMIYLYSKEHISPEKALSAFDRYIHYADALPQRHNLFDEAIMMKAECKYLMQDVDAAYLLVEKLVPSSTKAALRAMKYLSASTDSNKQQQAVEILKDFMQQNPYIVMQILEDYDLLSNTFITDYLSMFKIEVSKEINQLIPNLDIEMKSLMEYSLSRYKNIVDEHNALKARAKYICDLGVVDTLMTKEKLLMMLEKIRDTINMLAEQERLAYLKTQSFVDLGLPSGTLWKDKNEENGLYTYELALDIFGDRLPTKEQFEELRNKCHWEWVGDGYKITGPSGNSINLLAAGCRNCFESVSFETIGYFWSSTPNGSEYACNLLFNSGGVYMRSNVRSLGFSVRLVQKKSIEERSHQEWLSKDRAIQKRLAEERLEIERAKQKRLTEERLAYLKAHGLVDLGVPSGTLWKDKNEKGSTFIGLAGFYQAYEIKDKLPSKEQFEELINRCRWEWMSDGYKVTGPNGNYIFLPAEGFCTRKGNVYYEGSYGRYWSSTETWSLDFNPRDVYMNYHNSNLGQCVRLVQDYKNAIAKHP